LPRLEISVVPLALSHVHETASDVVRRMGQFDIVETLPRKWQQKIPRTRHSDKVRASDPLM
jgi:hypothetical protein